MAKKKQKQKKGNVNYKNHELAITAWLVEDLLLKSEKSTQKPRERDFLAHILYGH